MSSFKNLSKSKKIIIIVAIVLFLAFSFVKTYFPSLGLSSWQSNINSIASGTLNDAENNSLSVHFIDVGQGDCTLVKTDAGSVLIDTGNSTDGDMICQYLLSRNVSELDYLVITHPHSDHYGGAVRLLDLIKVKNVLMPKDAETVIDEDESFAFTIDKLIEKDVSFYAAKEGDKYEIGDAVFTVLCANRTTDDINGMSVVLRLDYGETSFMFMGDAEKEIEQQLINSNLNLKCDVLKAGHHGSSNASTKEFLKATNPSIAVFSCGYDNDYGHPAEDVLYRLKKNNISYLRTDLNGNIVIGSDKEKLYCWFEKGQRY